MKDLKARFIEQIEKRYMEFDNITALKKSIDYVMVSLSSFNHSDMKELYELTDFSSVLSNTISDHVKALEMENIGLNEMKDFHDSLMAVGNGSIKIDLPPRT